MVKKFIQLSVITATTLFSTANAFAACPTATEAAYLAAQYINKQSVSNPVDLSIADAQCGRDKFVGFLSQQLTKIVGYKVGLTNPAVQKKFNHDQPVLGVLFKEMLLPDGSEVSVSFGVRPLFEADLLVRVKDIGINKAKTPEQVMQHIDAIIPFIELPDLLVEEPTKLNGATLTYINVGARLGIIGKPVPIKHINVSQLAEMSIRVVEGDNNEIDRGKGSDIMGHPLNAVVWIAQELARSGNQLKPGDLLSIGSFSKLRPPKAGQNIRVVYEGIKDSPSVSVKFR